VYAPLNSSSIKPGSYKNAVRATEQAGYLMYDDIGKVKAPGLYLSRIGLACGKVSGSFDVREMKLSGAGTVEKLAVDFVHKCEQRNENTVIGAFRFNSSVSVQSGLAKPPVVQKPVVQKPGQKPVVQKPAVVKNVTLDLPTLPEKAGSPPLPSAVQESMQSILPIMNTKYSDGKLQEKGWRTSFGTLTVIDKVSKGTRHTYFALTAGHIVGDGPDKIRSKNVKKLAVRTPAGKMEPLTVIGLVTDNNNPAYANRDLALVSFASNTQIPVAQRASYPMTASGSQHYVAGYPAGLTEVMQGTPYGNDFTTDPAAHIGKPLQTPGKVLSDGPSLNGFATQMITVPTVWFAPIPTRIVQRSNGTYPKLPEMTVGDRPERTAWNPSGIAPYNANTHYAHSGSPVLDQQGKVVAVHNTATRDVLGKDIRGQSLAFGSFLDNTTINIMNSLIQIEKNKIK
jgi:hypothetical protein